MSTKRKTAAKPSTSAPLETMHRIFSAGRGRGLESEVLRAIFCTVMITQAINRLVESNDRLVEAMDRTGKAIFNKVI